MSFIWQKQQVETNLWLSSDQTRTTNFLFIWRRAVIKQMGLGLSGKTRARKQKREIQNSDLT